MISSLLSLAAGFLVFFSVLHFTMPQREVRRFWASRTATALALAILMWKLTPLWTRWETVFSNPLLLISMNAGLAAIMGGLFTFLAILGLSLVQVRKERTKQGRAPLLIPVAVGLGVVALWTFTEPLVVPRPGSDPGAALQTLVPDLEGRPHALADWQGKVVVINFWATWCTPCLAELPEFQTFAQKPSSKVVVLGVNLIGTEKGGEKAVIQFATKNKMSWAQLIDPNAVLQKAFEVASIPTTVVLDPQGRVVDRRVGTVDLFWLRTLETRFAR